MDSWGIKLLWMFYPRITENIIYYFTRVQWKPIMIRESCE